MEPLGLDDPRLAAPGSFGLMTGPRDARPHYIGRHDTAVGGAVQTLLDTGCPMCGVRVHAAQVEPRASAGEAYADECGLWHRYGPTPCNAEHPAPPAGAACPHPDCA